MDEKEKVISKAQDFDNKVHKLGIITTLIIWAFFIAVPLGISLYFKLELDYMQVFSVALPIAITFAITGLAEKLANVPVIGPGAVYLASSTGNVSNMKLPAAINAMRIMNCEEGSEKGRVISIIAVATSAVVTTTIVFLGMLFLAPIVTPLLTNPVVKPAFDNMFPALLGPLVLPVILKNPKASAVPFTFAIIFALVLGNSYGSLQSFVMVGVILLTIGVSRIMYNKK